MANEYDSAARNLARVDPLGLLRWIAPDLGPDVQFLDWIDTRNVPDFRRGDPDRTGDLFAQLDDPAFPGERSILVIEVMTHAQAIGPIRPTAYAIELLKCLQYSPATNVFEYRVSAVLVNLVGTTENVEIVQGVRGLPDSWMKLKVAVRNVGEFWALDVLDAVERGALSCVVLGLVPLMLGGGDPLVVARCRALIAGYASPEGRAMVVAVALVFAGLTDSENVWIVGLEGIDVRGSTMVARWRQEGRDEGQLEGRQEGRRDALRTLLTTRFGPAFTPADVEAIEAANDPNVLERWTVLVLNVSSMEEFRQRAFLELGAEANGANAPA